VLVIVETVLLVLLLRALGELRQKGVSRTDQPVQYPALGGLAVGEPAPLFAARDQNGKEVKLEDFQGHRRILAFISPWCSACASAIAALDAFMEHERAIQLLVVGSTNSEQNRMYAAEHSERIPILTPDSDRIEDAYSVRGFPLVFVIDEAGVIKAKGGVNHPKQVQMLVASAFPSVTNHA
jgi:peroxiredoxin